MIDAALRPLVVRDYWLLDVPNHTNSGDAFIWQGEQDYLRHLTYKCLGIRTVIDKNLSLPENALVLFHGGGNFGDLWVRHHDYRKVVMTANPTCTFIVLPQTVWYEDKARMSEDREFFARFRMKVFARDAKSFARLQEILPDEKIGLIPDMAFWMEVEPWQEHCEPQGRLMLVRDDKELAYSASLLTALDSHVPVGDWPSMTERRKGGALCHCASNPSACDADYYKFLKDVFKPYVISTAVTWLDSFAAITTTRLHGCIMSVLLGKHQIELLDNSYGKNSSFFETWLADCEGVVLSPVERSADDEQLNRIKVLLHAAVAASQKGNSMPTVDKFLPVVTIVVPVYNVEDFVADTLESILGQTYPNIELICVDDGSTDASRSVVERYRDKFVGSKKLTLITRENGGISAARNSGMDLATGKYLYFLDSDDKISPDAIGELVALAESKGLDQVLFSCDVFEDGSDADLHKRAEAFRRYYALPPNVCNRKMSGDVLLSEWTSVSSFPCNQALRFYRRDILEKNHCRFPEGLIHEDNYFAPVSLRHAEHVMVVDRPFYQRRVRAESIMTSSRNKIEKLHGMVGVCIALLNDQCLWSGSPSYVAGLRRLILSLIRAISQLSRDVQESEWVEAIEGLLAGNSERRLWVEFILPALKKQCATDEDRRRAVEKCKRAEEVVKHEQAGRKRAEEARKRAEESRKQFEHACKRAEKALKDAEIEITNLNGSTAYHVGMFITWPARKTWGGFKWLRQSGLVYIFTHLIGKGARKFVCACLGRGVHD